MMLSLFVEYLCRRGNNSAPTAARMSPAAKFWKTASIFDSTSSWLRRKDATSMAAQGNDPTSVAEERVKWSGVK